jgi:hypothetical protein
MGIKKGDVLDYSTFDILFSLNRKLNPGYTGFCIELFRVSDSVIANFDWDGNNFPVSEIETWAGSSDIHVNAFYNMGTDNASIKYTWNTERSILGVGGVVNQDINGKVYAQGVTGNNYFNDFHAPAIDGFGVLTNDLVYSFVVKTQNQVSWEAVFAERAITGNLYHCNVFSDTRTNRFAYQRRPNQAINQNRVWNEDLQQNTKLIISGRMGDNGAGTNNSSTLFYKNKVRKTISTAAVGTLANYPLGDTLRQHFMQSNIPSTGNPFTGEMYEFVNISLKENPVDPVFCQELMDQVVDDQNLFYDIY